MNPGGDQRYVPGSVRQIVCLTASVGQELIQAERVPDEAFSGTRIKLFSEFVVRVRPTWSAVTGIASSLRRLRVSAMSVRSPFPVITPTCGDHIMMLKRVQPVVALWSLDAQPSGEPHAGAAI
jgi:hypothetical protein